jgi:hypothetical protein
MFQDFYVSALSGDLKFGVIFEDAHISSTHFCHANF